MVALHDDGHRPGGEPAFQANWSLLAAVGLSLMFWLVLAAAVWSLL